MNIMSGPDRLIVPNHLYLLLMTSDEYFIEMVVVTEIMKDEFTVKI